MVPALRAGRFTVWAPEELIGSADKVEDRGTVVFQPLAGGFPPEKGWKSRELLKDAIPKPLPR